MDRLKITTILGTRPEIIRLACVLAALDECTDHRIVHTGQNYDYELNQVFFDDLGIRKPDQFMNVDTTSLGTVLAGILTATETELKAYRPDAILILGDTNSALAAIIARRMKVPIYHMEAGNRCFDVNVPEETNRRSNRRSHQPLQSGVYRARPSSPHRRGDSPTTRVCHRVSDERSAHQVSFTDRKLERARAARSGAWPIHPRQHAP